jgi:hypothetical protein
VAADPVKGGAGIDEAPRRPRGGPGDRRYVTLVAVSGT